MLQFYVVKLGNQTISSLAGVNKGSSKKSFAGRSSSIIIIFCYYRLLGKTTAAVSVLQIRMVFIKLRPPSEQELKL